MASTSQQAPAGARAPDEGWGRTDNALLGLTATTLILLAAQFALAGFGAFTKITSPAVHGYGAHMVLGIVIGALTWLIVAAIVASRSARAHRGTVWLAVTMAILTIPVEPLLAATRRRQPNHRTGPGGHR